MPMEGGRVQDLMAYYAVVAALICTVTYGGVLAPPKELSTCTELCRASTARLVLGIRAAFGVCLPQEQTSSTAGDAQTCQPLVSPSVDGNRLLWGEYHRPFVLNYLDSFNTSTTSGAYQGEPLDPFFQAFVVFNAFALLFSLACIAVGVIFTHSAMVRDEGTGRLDNLELIRLMMKWTLLISLLCAFIAFLFAHFFVFWYDGMQNTGIVVVWIVSALVFAAMGGFMCWFYRGNVKESVALL